MCKYCDFYVRQSDDPEYIPIFSTKTKVVEKLVTMETDVCIVGKYNSKSEEPKPTLLLVHTYVLNGNEGLSENSHQKAIKYCPFCGIDLEFARKSFEEAKCED